MNKFISQTNTALKKKKKRWTTKGRQVEDIFLNEVSKLLYGKDLKRDELIEYLHIIQDSFGVLYDKHLVALASLLNIPYTEVYEVATFYSMYNLSPVGKYFIQVCTTTPCMIRGANKLVEACKEKISENESELSIDKNC